MFFLCISCRLKAFSFVFYLCCQSSSCCPPSTSQGGNFFLLLSTTISSSPGLRGFRNEFNALICTVPTILCIFRMYFSLRQFHENSTFPILQNCQRLCLQTCPWNIVVSLIYTTQFALKVRLPIYFCENCNSYKENNNTILKNQFQNYFFNC